jgi:transcriptional regulator with XRE-family HTH domain
MDGLTMETTQRIALKRNDDGLKQDVADGLLALRTARGWTRKELAELLFDVTPNNLAVWETRVRPPAGMHLLRVARLLGLDLSTYPTDAIRASRVLHAQRLAQREGKKPKPVIDIASLVAMARIQSGLSFREFAARWDVTINSLRNWEDGILPSGENAVKVAGQLGLPSSAIAII